MVLRVISLVSWQNSYLKDLTFVIVVVHCDVYRVVVIYENVCYVVVVQVLHEKLLISLEITGGLGTSIGYQIKMELKHYC